MSFTAFVATQDAYDACIEGVAESNDRRKTLEKLGYDAYHEFFNSNTIPDTTDKDELVESAFATQFIDYAQAAVGDYKYVSKGCKSALKKLIGLREGAYFEGDIDAFESFLQTQLNAVNEYRTTRFPVGEPNDDRLDHRDLILTDDH